MEIVLYNKYESTYKYMDLLFILGTIGPGRHKVNFDIRKFNEYLDHIIRYGDILNSSKSIKSFCDNNMMPTHLVEDWSDDLEEIFVKYPGDPLSIITSDNYRVILRSGYSRISLFILEEKGKPVIEDLYTISKFTIDEILIIHKVFTNSIDVEESISIDIDTDIYHNLEASNSSSRTNCVYTSLFNPIDFGLYTIDELLFVHQVLFDKTEALERLQKTSYKRFDKTLLKFLTKTYLEVDDWYIQNFILKEKQIRHYETLTDILYNNRFVYNTSETSTGKTVVSCCYARLSNRSIIVIYIDNYGTGYHSWIKWCKYLGVRLFSIYSYNSFSFTNTSGIFNCKPVVGSMKRTVHWCMLVKILIITGTLIVYDEIILLKGIRSIRTKAAIDLNIDFHTILDKMIHKKSARKFIESFESRSFTYKMMGYSRCESKMIFLSALPTDTTTAGMLYLSGITSPHKEFYIYDNKEGVYINTGMRNACKRAVEYYKNMDKRFAYSNQLYANIVTGKGTIKTLEKLIFDKYIIEARFMINKTIEEIRVKVNITIDDLDTVNKIMDLWNKYIALKENNIGSIGFYPRMEIAIENIKVIYTAHFVKHLLDSNNGIKSILLACKHRDPQRRLYNILKGYKYRIDVIHGDVDISDRLPILNKFIYGKLQILLVTYGTVAMGDNLAHPYGEESRVCVLIPIYRYERMLQISGRVARDPVERSKTYIIFIDHETLKDAESNLYLKILNKEYISKYSSGNDNMKFTTENINIKNADMLNDAYY